MKIQKLLRQYGEHGNDYSVLEIGDKINEILDYIQQKEGVIEFLEKKNDDKFYSKNEAAVEFESLKQPEETFTPIKGEMAVRSPSTQDKVYLIRDGKKHWIKNPETLNKLGFNFHNVKNITNEEMDKYETDESLDLRDDKPLEVIAPKDGFDKYNL